MSDDVYANGMEISCKQGMGKSICAFPDVCMTPPQTPATPPGVPVPYPNTGMASDTTSGSTSVQISGQEVMLKNKSYFKRSMGDEAGCAPKKGVMTSVNMGKVYFIAWSMDVKFEGENVVRHFDMTTHNHGSNPNSPPCPHASKQALGGFSKCAKEEAAVQTECIDKNQPPCPGALGVSVENQQKEWVRVQKKVRGWKAKEGALPAGTHDALKHHIPSVRKDQSATVNAARMATADANSCVKAMRCHLRPKEPNKGQSGCCPGQTPNHIPPAEFFDGKKKYQYGQALCVCLEGMTQHVGTHGDNHALIDHFAQSLDLKDAGGKSKGVLADQDPAKLNDAITVCSKATAEQTGCSQECIDEQLTAHFTDTQKLPPQTTNVSYKKLAGQASIQRVGGGGFSR